MDSKLKQSNVRNVHYIFASKFWPVETPLFSCHSIWAHFSPEPCINAVELKSADLLPDD